jgi:hypothetical protein
MNEQPPACRYCRVTMVEEHREKKSPQAPYDIVTYKCPSCGFVKSETVST